MDVRIKILSDCHIGIPGAAENDFHFSDDEFIAYLEESRTRYDFVILNGDIWELWESGKLSTIDRFSALAETHSKLFEYIRDHLGNKNLSEYVPERNLYYIAGNHDSMAARYNALIFGGRVLQCMNLEMNGGIRVHISHGHEYDPANSGYFAWVGRTITWCVGVMESCINRDADETLGVLAAQEFQSCARKALDANQKFDVVVAGHTHDAGVWVDKENARIYANSGGARGPKLVDEIIMKHDTKTKELVIMLRKYNVHERTYSMQYSESMRYE